MKIFYVLYDLKKKAYLGWDIQHANIVSYLTFSSALIFQTKEKALSFKSKDNLNYYDYRKRDQGYKNVIVVPVHVFLPEEK